MNPTVTAFRDYSRRTWAGRNITIILIVAAFICATMTYAAITDKAAPLGTMSHRVRILLIVDAALLASLAAVISSRLFRLWKAVKINPGGSRLQRRVLLLFSIVTIAPTITVSVFSALFFNLGIQAWFNDRVQTAVDESLVVAEAYLNEHRDNLRADALAMASDLNQVATVALTNPAEFQHDVAVQAEVRVLTECIVFQHNRIIAQGPLSFALAFEHIPQDALERASHGEAVILTSEGDKVQALVKLDALDDAYLLVGRLVDSKVLAHVQNAQGAVSEYDTLKSQLEHLQLVFSIIFGTLALLLLLSSIGYGMIFASRLTNPISGLVTATERVRGGDFSARVEDAANKDEIGMLGRAFNRMTEQLQAQRTELIEANRRLDERRRFSEAVLSGVSAGVIALDNHKMITLSNRSASSILQVIGQPVDANSGISEVLPGIEDLLTQVEQLPGEVAQSTLTLNKNGKAITLHLRVSIEKIGEEVEGYIVTFDDVTELVSAQRTAAWADVARKIAHEIKNPLTPIQLSAERLKRKYLKFITEDQDSYVRYIDTITKHVGDIGKMVEEFVSFARMPTPIFANEDITNILRKAAFSAQVANPSIEYDAELPLHAVIVYCDERQIGQIMTNLLKNAAEAIESRMAQQPENQEKGRILLKLADDGKMVNITIEDNGGGFPADIKKMLEPYVTTRAKGTGLGLAIVKKIVEDHKGKIELENINGGARVTLSFLQQCDINAADA